MYVETKIASIIYGVTTRAIRIACERNSKQHIYRYESGRGRGGKRLLIHVDDALILDAIERGTVSRDEIDSLHLQETELQAFGAFGALSGQTGLGFQKPKPQESKAPQESTPKTTEELADSAFALASPKAREKALLKLQVINEWESAKKRALKEATFIDYINAKLSLKLTPNRLYAWQRRYRSGGLDALLDSRGAHKAQDTKLHALGLTEACERLILAQRGRINIANIHKALNYHAVVDLGLLEAGEFLGKEKEAVSYEVVARYVKDYLKRNRIARELIEFGEDGVVSRNLPALGQSNWEVTSINQVVEIDSSPLDVMCDVGELASELGLSSEAIMEWQKRYCVIALIDTYSKVCTMHICESENSVGIARAISKYISRYGIPRSIKGDNGKAFLSKHTQGVLHTLGIEYRKVRAYSGWLKPYVERNFKSLQHQFSEWLRGYIGHNISERQAIEFFYSKRERRLKKGQKSNLKNLLTLRELEERIDNYLEKIHANSAISDRTPKELYDAKAHEAKSMSELSLSLKLMPLELRRVGKKGVSFQGTNYYSSALFSHERVYVAQNINNINEVFVFDESKELLDVAQTLREGEITIEESKLAQKHFKRVLKRNKEALKEARERSEVEMERLFSAISERLEAPKNPKAQSEDTRIKASLERSKTLRDGEIRDELLEQESKERRNISYEEAVLNSLKMA